MSTVHQETAFGSSEQLEAMLPDWCALRWHDALLCGLFVAAFLYFSYLPVSSPQTWHEVSLGQRSVRDSIDLVPMAEGMRHEALGHAGVVLVAKVYAWKGPSFLGSTFAFLQTGVLILWSLVFYRLTKRWWSVLGSFWLALWVLFDCDGFHCQIFGQLAFACLALLLLDSKSPRWSSFAWHSVRTRNWFCVALLFVLWANLHASVILGLLWLGCFAMAAAMMSFRRKHPFAFIANREFQSRVWLFELAMVATTLTPRGAFIWKIALWWPDNPFFHALGGSQPANMAGWYGMMVAVAWGIWFHIGRSGMRLSPFLTLSMAIGTLLIALMKSTVVWFAPIMIMAIFELVGRRSCVNIDSTSANLDDVLHDKTHSTASKPRSLRFAFTLIGGLIIWLGFCLSPFGTVVLGSQPRTDRDVVGANFPWNTKDFLAAHPPKGLLTCPLYWSDWFQCDHEIPVLINSDIHLVPKTVLRDYHAIYHGESKWSRLADKYGVTEIVIDKRLQIEFVSQVRREVKGWSIAHEDRHAMLLRRNP